MSHLEQELLRKYAEEGDAEAFRRLVEQHGDMVFAVCNRLLRNAADAEDAAQNCFLEMATNARRLKAPIAGWLHRVAVRVSVSLYRKNQSRRSREARATEQGAGSYSAPWAEVRESLDEAVADLPERLRTPIVLHYLEGRTQEEIAAQLGTSQSTVSRHLSQGVAALRKRLKKAGVLVSLAALGSLISANAAEAAPAGLVNSTGKLALAGTVGSKSATGVKILTIGGMSVLKVSLVSMIAASALVVGGVVVRRALAQNPPPPLVTIVAPAPAPVPAPAAAPAAVAGPKLPWDLGRMLEEQQALELDTPLDDDLLAEPVKPVLTEGAIRQSARANPDAQVFLEARTIACKEDSPKEETLAALLADMDVLLFPAHSELPIPTKGNATAVSEVLSAAQDETASAKAILTTEQARSLVEFAKVSKDLNIMQSPALTLMNGERSTIKLVTKTSYIRGMGTDGKPEIGTFNSGTAVYMQPLVQADGKSVWFRADIRSATVESANQVEVTAPDVKYEMTVPSLKRSVARVSATLAPGKAFLQILRGYSGGEMELVIVEATVLPKGQVNNAAPGEFQPAK